MIQAIRCMLGMHTWDKAILDPHAPDAGWYCEHCPALDWFAEVVARWDEPWEYGWRGADGSTIAFACRCYAERGELAWEDTSFVEQGFVEYANERRMTDDELCFHDMRRAGVEYALLA